MRSQSMGFLARVPWFVLLGLLLALSLSKLATAEPLAAKQPVVDRGEYKTQSFLLELRDKARDRQVPIKVYRPTNAEGPRPVVLVSHGLGGSRQGLSYLGKHWSSHGYICVHMQHVGSDDAVWKNVKPRERLKAMRKAAMDPNNALNRAKDSSFLIDELERMNADKASRLFGSLDLKKIGIAGHSFGAWTSMAAGGMVVGGNAKIRLIEPRIRCMIPLSPPVVSNKKWYKQSYGTLAIPALFMTGTLDTSVITPTTAAQRLVPYQTMPGVSAGGVAKYVINFDGADHMTFSGETQIRKLMRKADPKTDPVFHALILQSTTQFLDAFLLDDKKALQWLNQGAFSKVVGKHGDVEMDAAK